ncbi:SDR family oxidoreductase [Paenibacillus sp. FSL K6-1330]|uniref:SDR family oxidoreductase n=1 Tax=Paenibacillus sp. FSL K6-1330 TaxID=2975292 RepID=UPI0030DBAE20
MSNVKDQVVIIMGASSGIGEATARKLAEQGARLVISARREDRLKKLKASMPDASMAYQTADVTNDEEVQKVINLAMKEYGRIDAIFNNAGIMPTAPLAESRKQEWKAMLDVNIMGVLNGISAVLPIMQKQHSGKIITTSSVAGHVVYPDSAVYCGTKFAVRAIMEGLRQEERENNIQSIVISPGAVDTELYTSIHHEENRKWVQQNSANPELSMKSEDIADAVAYVVGTPNSVSISEMVIRPTKQPI